MKKKLEIITLISTMLTICISSYASAEDAASKKFRNGVRIFFSVWIRTLRKRRPSNPLLEF